MTDLVPVQDQMQMAELLAASDLVPRAFRGKPANVLLAAQLGQSLGLNPAVAMTAVQVIEGTPSLSANAQAALVRRAGHKLRITSTDTEARAELVRSDDPDFVAVSVWTVDRAKAAGLWGKGAWAKYPGSMLTARATTEVIRNAAPDVLLGVAYDPEELGAAWPDEDTGITQPLPPPAPVIEAAPEPAPPLSVDADRILAMSDLLRTVDEARDLYRQAQQHDLLDATLPDSTLTLGEHLMAVGQDLAAVTV